MQSAIQLASIMIDNLDQLFLFIEIGRFRIKTMRFFCSSMILLELK